jgi:hypothetical protein
MRALPGVTEKVWISFVGKPVTVSSLGKASDAQDETEMTHTLIGADRATHLKILAIAIARAVAVALVGRNAGVPGSDVAAGRAQASRAAIEPKGDNRSFAGSDFLQWKSLRQSL